MRPSSYSCCFEIIPDAASPSTGSSISLAERLLLSGHRKQHRARALNGFKLNDLNSDRIIAIFLVGFLLN